MVSTYQQSSAAAAYESIQQSEPNQGFDLHILWLIGYNKWQINDGAGTGIRMNIQFN